MMRMILLVVFAGLAIPALVSAQAPCNPAVEECR